MPIKNQPPICTPFHVIFVTFQIEENTKHIGESHIQSSASFGSDSRRRSSGWKVGARNALLQWCKEVITPKFGIHVDNFGASWRDGRAFVALISALNPGKQFCYASYLLFSVLPTLKMYNFCSSNYAQCGNFILFYHSDFT